MGMKKISGNSKLSLDSRLHTQEVITKLKKEHARAIETVLSDKQGAAAIFDAAAQLLVYTTNEHQLLMCNRCSTDSGFVWDYKFQAIRCRCWMPD